MKRHPGRRRMQVTFPESDLIALREAAAQNTRVLISTHIHPDADAIGSALAAAEIIRKLGGEPVVVLDDEVPVRCRLLPGSDSAVRLGQQPENELFRVALIVDSGSLARIGDVQNLIEKDAMIVNADHHLSNDRFGRINWISLECASTTELLFDLCRALNVPITPSLADNLFAGLLSDTGRFRYSNTTARSFAIASDLVAAGARITEITNGLYFDVSAKDVLSLSEIYSTLELYDDGRISTMFVRLEQVVEDPDSVVDLAVSLRGVQTAALLSETSEGKIRVSLRSRNEINVAQIAERFGGGGHAKAAGFRMKGTLESVRERLLPELLSAVNAGQMSAALTES